VLALLAVGFAYAWVMQVNGFNQTAHYALVRSLADGTPNIDRSRGEVGDLSTGDAAVFEGHYYAAKPPGLAAATLPAFLAVEATGMRTTGDPTRVIWALHLWSIVLPAVGLLLLVWWAGNRLEPGLGLAAAATTGLGTLILPFSTLFFSHVPSAFLGFAAFALLLRERDGEPSLGLLAAAGLLAGLAVTVEYPLVLVAAILGLYALLRAGRLRRGLAYGAGVVAGVVPLLAFNVWAFGSPTHIAHEDFFQSPEHETEGIFGFSWPSADSASQLLFSSMGLLVLAPVLVAGAAGAVLMLRRPERRPEALVVIGIAAAYLLYNAALRSVSPFGGLGPPRYLVTVMPFLGVTLAVAYRRFPLTTLALALVSAFQLVVQAATGPLAAYDGLWLTRARERAFSQTAASLVGITGWPTIVLFFAAALVGVAAAVLATRRPEIRRSELPLAVGAALGWGLLALAADNPSGVPPGTAYVAVAAAALLGLSAVLAWRFGEGGWTPPAALGPARRGQGA
jgi:hypothetical protein